MNKIFYCYKLIVFLLSTILIITVTSCAIQNSSVNINDENISLPFLKVKEVDEKVASDYALYAMMSSNVYHKDDPLFPLETIGWNLVDLDGNKIGIATYDDKCGLWGTGLAYDIYEHINNKDVVFVFRGTDDLCDISKGNIVVASRYYKKAFKEFHKYSTRNSNKEIIVSGHSLGGGLAIAVSIRNEGIHAVVFDSSPVTNGVFIEDIEINKRVLIYQNGEFLESVRKATGFFDMFDILNISKFNQAITKDNVYQSNFNFKGVNNHSSRALAINLLKFGSTKNFDLKKLCDVTTNCTNLNTQP